MKNAADLQTSVVLAAGVPLGKTVEHLQSKSKQSNRIKNHLLENLVAIDVSFKNSPNGGFHNWGITKMDGL